METTSINPIKKLTRKQIIGSFFAKYPPNKPLNERFIEPKVLMAFLPILLKTERIEARETSSGSGILLLCPQCGKPSKLFYSYGGRMFLCLDYQKCGWKCHTLGKLKKTMQRWARTKELPLAPRASEVYVDYALHSKVGIYSDDPNMRISYIPGASIHYQIEGEALAIKAGIWHWLRNRQGVNNHLIIYTDSKTLLAPFNSSTQAGEWWKEAHQIARENKIHLELKFVASQKNPADQLTRDARTISRQRERKRHFYEEWLAKSSPAKGDYNTEQKESAGK